MGYKLIILLGLLLGVLYCIHILVQDYQAVTAPRLLRLLFKRDINTHNYSRPSVRWRKILMYDRIQCTRFLYCTLGAQKPDEEIRRGLILMLRVPCPKGLKLIVLKLPIMEPNTEDRTSLKIFKEAYKLGQHFNEEATCRVEYPMCPFNSHLLIDLIRYLLRHQNATK
ncbi:unnamed protein product, partial [Iphiclides podalirius]